MIAASRGTLAIRPMLTTTTKVTQISFMDLVALEKHQIQQLVGHPCSVKSEKQTSMANNSFDWC